MTVRFPAFCPACGHIFPSRAVIDGKAREVTFTGVSLEACPHCGAPADLPDGTFNVVDDTIEALAASQLLVRSTFEAYRA